MSKRTTILLVVLAAFILIAYTQVTVFVIQPIGVLPDGSDPRDLAKRGGLSSLTEGTWMRT